ncbi:MAG TPA: DUF4395 domain-containing protein [Flavobacteriia bacterium]|jgi:hypothetical protein|nr:DUF4395 domain-containing protein [Flavobacteriia bacterium]
MQIFLRFGEKIDGYDYKVINERVARASAGIMFLFGILSLFSVHLYRTIFWAELFSITFIIEFIVRVLVNPTYAPYMLIGDLIVSNQTPDWVEAKPKRFAWLLGMILGVIMTYYIIFDIITPIRLGICWLCLFLMFVESVFGICLGCILYKKLNRKLYNCPGGICETTTKKPYDKRNIIIILAFLGLFFLTYLSLKSYKFNEKPQIVIIKK